MTLKNLENSKDLFLPLKPLSSSWNGEILVDHCKHTFLFQAFHEMTKIFS